MTLTANDAPCSDSIGNLAVPPPSAYNIKTNAAGQTTVLGIEGSANKVGVGVLRYDPSSKTYETLSNPRKTYIPPTGQGFLPRETAWHHQNHIVALVRAALTEAFPDHPDPTTEISAICFTKGPGMGGPLTSCAIASRTLVSEPKIGM